MFHNYKDINLDALRSQHLRLYYFGLGFIQLKIDETYRLHFYNSELPSITEDPHNHRYNFVSRVLKGHITNTFYKVTPGSTHAIRNESCNPDIVAPTEEKLCALIEDTVCTYTAGESYTLTDDIFHSVEGVDCITLLKRSPYTKEFAQVITPAGVTTTCPFSMQIPEKRLWQIMEDMLI